MSNSHINFKLSSPNRGLFFAGIVLLLILVYSTYRESPAIVFGIGFLVKILVLVWMPKAARLVGRNGVGWTIFAFITPSIALIILGSIGYRYSSETKEMLKKCSKAMEDKHSELKKKLSDGLITQTQFDTEIDSYYTELQDYAREYLNSVYDNENTNFLNEQLKRKGFVLDEDSDVFVEFNDKCPACGSFVKSEMEECPDCGLNLR